MKKFLTLLSVLLLINLFSVAVFAEDTPPSVPDAFLEVADDAPPSLLLDTTGDTSSSSSSSGSSGSYVKKTTTPTTTTYTPAATTAPAPTADDNSDTSEREISGTGPEMIYLIILGLLLIGGYQFAMRRK